VRISFRIAVRLALLPAPALPWLPPLFPLLPACDWAAADGPWNAPPEGEEPTLLRPLGSTCTPDGERGAGFVSVTWTDVVDDVAFESVSDAWGDWQGTPLAAGRYTVRLDAGRWDGLATVVLPEPSSLTGSGDGAGGDGGPVRDLRIDPLCLGAERPRALVARGAGTAPTDAVLERIRGLGLLHAQEGPSDATALADLLATPQGLSEYGIVALGGGLDLASLTDDDAALGGLFDFLAAGGGLYLSAEAWELAESLLPGSVHPAAERSADHWTQAALLDPLLAEALQWGGVGLPLPEGAFVAAPFSEETGGPPKGVEILAAADVELASGAALAQSPLLLRSHALGGALIWSAVPAPLPAPDEWWMGSPLPWSLPDGTWDGRGALLDRVFLGL
jgi:hypothetical protein